MWDWLELWVQNLDNLVASLPSQRKNLTNHLLDQRWVELAGAFRDLSHDEASAAAQALYRGLREGAAGAVPLLVEVVARAGGCWVRAVVGPLALLACPRRPGQPYQPLLCAEADASAHAAALTAVLRPAEGAEQELYFNTRFFDRQP